jgi:hypothetical protein
MRLPVWHLLRRERARGGMLGRCGIPRWPADGPAIAGRLDTPPWDASAGITSCGCSTERLRPAGLAQPQARPAIEKLAGDLEVAGVSCGFFDHVQNHPAHGGDLGIDFGIAVAALRPV